MGQSSDGRPFSVSASKLEKRLHLHNAVTQLKILEAKLTQTKKSELFPNPEPTDGSSGDDLAHGSSQPGRLPPESAEDAPNSKK